MSYAVRAGQWAAIAKQLGIACIIAGMVLRYFYVQQQLREQEQSELQSRIQALQSRIRPHFLFNSMNIIASLISVDPETAESVVEDLSELFRASLNDAGNQVLLTEELELCERYVRIEQLRLGDRLKARLGHRRIPRWAEDPAADTAAAARERDLSRYSAAARRRHHCGDAALRSQRRQRAHHQSVAVAGVSNADAGQQDGGQQHPQPAAMCCTTMRPS